MKDNTIKLYEMMVNIKTKKANIVNTIKKNMKSRESMIIDHKTHSDIDNLQTLAQEIAKLNDINEHTQKWIDTQFASLKRLDFEVKNDMKNHIAEHDKKMDHIINFLKKRY